ncbi:MAG: hypothetical protein KDJ66_11895 [Nitratireductor sp.]|nr:hypothetical protein [Nitratireductor sp.]
MQHEYRDSIFSLAARQLAEKVRRESSCNFSLFAGVGLATPQSAEPEPNLWRSLESQIAGSALSDSADSQIRVGRAVDKKVL